MNSIHYNAGYQDGKNGYNFDLSRIRWTHDEAKSYNEGWRRGKLVHRTLKSRLVQGRLFAGT